MNSSAPVDPATPTAVSYDHSEAVEKSVGIRMRRQGYMLTWQLTAGGYCELPAATCELACGGVTMYRITVFGSASVSTTCSVTCLSPGLNVSPGMNGSCMTWLSCTSRVRQSCSGGYGALGGEARN